MQSDLKSHNYPKYGILRWASLKGIPTQVKKKEDFGTVNRHIVATLILYNLPLRFKDEWTEEDGIVVEEAPGIQERAGAQQQADEAALMEGENGPKNRRKVVQERCLAWFYINHVLV